MASTRRINNPGDYEIEQHSNNNKINYLTTQEYGVPNRTFLPGNGLLQGRVASENISSNGTDIESSLFGIGSTNLVQPQQPIYPSLRNLDTIKFFERPNEVIMPQPLIINNDQRPFII